VQLPWPPVLSELQLKRGLAYYGGGQRMERVAAALMAGQPITAVRGMLWRLTVAGRQGWPLPQPYLQLSVLLK